MTTFALCIFLQSFISQPGIRQVFESNSDKTCLTHPNSFVWIPIGPICFGRPSLLWLLAVFETERFEFWAWRVIHDRSVTPLLRGEKTPCITFCARSTSVTPFAYQCAISSYNVWWRRDLAEMPHPSGQRTAIRWNIEERCSNRDKPSSDIGRRRTIGDWKRSVGMSMVLSQGEKSEVMWEFRGKSDDQAWHNSVYIHHVSNICR
jgi:hypothetical protein